MIIIFSTRTNNPPKDLGPLINVNQGGLHVEDGVAYWAFEIVPDPTTHPDVETDAFRTIADAEAWIISRAGNGR